MTRSRAEHGAWVLAAVGFIASLIGWMALPAQFPHAWLAALTCWIGWPLGSLALIFIHALTGGRWGFAIRPQLLAGAATLPLVLPALVPVLFVQRSLYPWMHPEIAAHLDNRFYLNAPFFYSRAMIYLAVWVGLEVATLRAFKQGDPEAILYRLAPPGLILLALTVTFSAIDFTLSLEPHFSSSIYGMLVCCEAVLLALSVAVLGAALGLGGGISAERSGAGRDLGRLLFALVLLWAYLDFMQLLIVWNSDLPEESAWYLERVTRGWGAVAVLIATLHFLLPFLVLIWPQAQRSRTLMGLVAAMLVLIEVPRAWWIVIPPAGRSLGWLDAATMLALLGAAAGFACRSFARAQPKAPSHA